MSRKCLVTKRGPKVGNRVSHANNKRKRRFLLNLQWKRFWSERLKRYIRLRVSTKGIRIIDKKGIDTVLLDLKARGSKYISY